MPQVAAIRKWRTSFYRRLEGPADAFNSSYSKIVGITTSESVDWTTAKLKGSKLLSHYIKSVQEQFSAPFPLLRRPQTG